MAKKSNKADASQDAPSDDVTLSTLVLTRGTYTVKYSDLPMKSQVRMAVKAFNELMQDSTAFSKEQLDGKTESEIDAMKAEKRDARFNSILTGEFKVGGGGARLPQIDRVINEIAEERVKAIAVARKVPMPKGDVLKSAIAKIIARDPDGIKKDAQARIDSASALAGDLADVF